MPRPDVPDVVVRRLPLYVRTLDRLTREGLEVISSTDLGQRIGVSPAQIRKDLSYFGEFGRQGLGYSIAYLRDQLLKILQADRPWHVALVGAGALGQALVHYDVFARQNYHIVAVFDNDQRKVGELLGRLRIHGMDELPAVLGDGHVEIGILAVPAEHAQEVSEQLVRCGVRALLNYAPISLSLPDDVQVAHIDPVANLQTLSYYL